MKTTTRFWLALGVLALLSPLGLLVPALFKAGGAWGEWDAGTIAQRVGYAPRELARAGAHWQAPMPDYAFKGWEAQDMAHLGAAYLVSAVVGITLIAALAWLIGRLLTKKSDFVAHSLRGALAFLKEAVFAEETAALPGLLQGIDPRMKLVTVLLLLSVTLFTRSLAVLGMLYLLGLLLALCSRLRPGYFLIRTWVFIPLFSLAMALPALFSAVSPGTTVASIGGLRITNNGLHAAAFFIGRVAVSVSFVVLLSLTTRHTALLKTLRAFGVPPVFVMVFGICYRYIYLFVELVENTYRAIRSRTGGRMRHQHGRRLVAWNIGHLWSRSYALNEQVYQAMVSRGFRGEPVSLDLCRTRRRDWFWLAGVMVVCVGLLLIR